MTNTPPNTPTDRFVLVVDGFRCPQDVTKPAKLVRYAQDFWATRCPGVAAVEAVVVRDGAVVETLWSSADAP